MLRLQVRFYCRCEREQPAVSGRVQSRKHRRLNTASRPDLAMREAGAEQELMVGVGNGGKERETERKIA